MPTMEEKEALLEHLDRCEPEAWKALLRFTLPELVKEQGLLADIVCRAFAADRRKQINAKRRATIARKKFKIVEAA